LRPGSSAPLKNEDTVTIHVQSGLEMLRLWPFDG